MNAKEFVAKVAKDSPRAVSFGREQALRHYVTIAGSSKAEAEAFYEALKEALCRGSLMVLNAPVKTAVSMLETGGYEPILDNPSLSQKYNSYAKKREEAEKALGCTGLAPTYATVASQKEGDRGYGDCSMVLTGIKDFVLLCGDSFRLREPSRGDYVEDASLILYDKDHEGDCRAAAAMLSLDRHDVLAGPAKAIESVLNGNYGRCEAIIFDAVTPNNVKEAVVASKEQAGELRGALDKAERLWPLSILANGMPLKGQEAKADEASDLDEKKYEHPHFLEPNARVAMKPMPSNPRLCGTVLSASNGSVSIEWDNGEMSIYDLVEALSRVMPAPDDEMPAKEGMLAYELAGIDEESVMMLHSAGHDPISVYGLISHHCPASSTATGWEKDLIEALEAIGISAAQVTGFRRNPSGHRLAFSPHKWIEASLDGYRIVIDNGEGKPLVFVGDPDDYVQRSKQSDISIE